MTDEQKMDAVIQFVADRVSVKYKHRVELVLPCILCGINTEVISEMTGASRWTITKVHRLAIDALRGSLINGGGTA